MTGEIEKIMAHFSAENIKFDALYTGYLASVKQIDQALRLSKEFLNDGALIIVDPVMADHGKFYDGFDTAFAKKMSELTKAADIITPNVTEAFILADKPYKENYNKQDIAEISSILLNRGSRTVVITGVSFDEETSGAAYFYGSGTPIYYKTPKIPGIFHGTGDLFASCLTGAVISGKTIDASVKKAADFVVAAIIETLEYKDTHTYGVCFERALKMLN
jgi:pyridoxine kinase